MKVGLIARGEDRGLGRMTYAFDRWMKPERTLLVDLGPLGRGFRVHYDRFPHATVVGWDGDVFSDETLVRDWLAGLDVVYSAETFYDWRIVAWAREAGVATVLHTMPELYPLDRPEVDDVTEIWNPTLWRQDLLPNRTKVVAVPTEPVERPDFEIPDEPTWLHVAGHAAMGDRNGTTLVLAAVAQLRHRCTVRITTQDVRMPSGRAAPRDVHVEKMIGNTTDPADLYRGAHALVLPRRYGGLSLPIQEAAAHGLALVLPAISPNWGWPCEEIPVDPMSESWLAMKGGPVRLQQIDSHVVARTMNGLNADRDRWRERRASAYEWARSVAWSRMTAKYRTLLGDAAGAFRR